MGNNHIDAMTKKSKHPEHSRELMVGANQCGSDVEWALRAPDSDVHSGRRLLADLSPLQETDAVLQFYRIGQSEFA
jgi:hypothetical protein